jgi:signal transduction histidine kinase/DNA-binding response OmpR family regulator
MWSTLQTAGDRNSDFAHLSEELFEISSRRLILTTSLVGGSWLLAVVMYKAGQISMEILPVVLLVIGVFLISNWLVSRKLLLAQAVWLTGYALIITVAVLIFRLPDLIYLYTLIPFMAVTMIGWQGGVASILLVLGLLLGFTFLPGEELLTVEELMIAGMCGVLAGFIGWASVSSLLVMLEWSTDSYRTATDSLEEARNQRVELRQVQEDLVLANNELSRLTTRLKVMTEKAEEARRVKEEFVANVSHELRTPLNMIIGYTDLIMKSPQVYGKRIPARLLADISSIQRNSQHLVELINDVLDLSQVDAGRMALTKRWVSIREIIEGAIIAVQPLFESKGLYLQTEIPSDTMMVYCDSTRMREVVLNLLSNAGRLTEQGGIRVQVKEENHSIVVSVSDTGPGISEEDQAKLFEPFSQLDPMLNHRTGGSGLGLSISKRFVELHDGKMWLESQIGVGSTFFFSIPLGIQTEPLNVTPGATRWFNRYVEYTPRTRPYKAPRPEFIPRFVVVEKEKNIQRMLSRYTGRIEIVPAESLEAAAQQMEESPAQAVIINTQFSEESLPLIPTMPYNTPVVSCWIPGKEEAARRLGVVEYLLKPTRQEDLVAALDRFGKPGLSLLMVDDDPETLQLFARIISVNRPDYHVIRASNGVEALELMRARLPDVVLLDLMLPDLNGYQVLREKAMDPAIGPIPVVIISSNDPVGVPVISNQFSVRRSSGLSVEEFLDCILAVIGALNSEARKPGQAQPETALE